ncbi:heat-inducible transcription repressor HrcA [Mycoplasmatota bacterium]|nr:heat-inducible transcription repressor HrcA [Mycoplasmatota bacterium]
MLSVRKSLILKAIIEEFVRTAEPVGSKTLTELEELSCSSATIRNEMANLEDMGYLEKTHTSSGRIPSEKGYRYYVDEILKINKEKKSQFPKVDEIFGNYLLGNDEIINRTIKMISDLTSYTSMVLGPNSLNRLIKKIQVVKIAANEALLIIITDSGHIEKRKLFIDDLNYEEMQNVIMLLNELLINVPINQVSNKLTYDLKQSKLRDYLQYHELLLNAFADAFSRFSLEKHFVSGQYNLLYEPEFNDIDNVRSFINALEKKEIFSILEKNSSGVTVKIGSENRLKFMKECTLISVPYQIPTGEIGTIAVVGPKRMNYRKVIPLLEYIASNMSNFDK